MVSEREFYGDRLAAVCCGFEKSETEGSENVCRLLFLGARKSPIVMEGDRTLCMDFLFCQSRADQLTDFLCADLFHTCGIDIRCTITLC